MAKVSDMTKKERHISANIKRKLRRDLKEFKNFVNKYHSLDNFVNEKMSEYSDLSAITDEGTSIKYSYKDLNENINLFASGLQKLGVKKGDFISIFSENNGRWIIADQAVCKCGGISVLRGCYSNPEELNYILDFSEASGMICQTPELYIQLKPLLENKNIKFVILLFGNSDDENVYSYDEITELGKNHIFAQIQNNPEDSRIMLFTSGTTSMPRGVVLTHSNILHQIFSLSDVYYTDDNVGKTSLQYLPPWHAYEYSFLYVHISCGLNQHFTNITKIKEGIAKYNIDFITSVPKIWVDVKNKILDDLKQNSKLKYHIFNFGIKFGVFHKKCHHHIEKTTIYKKNNNIVEDVSKRFCYYITKPLYLLFLNTIFKDIRIKSGINFKDINCAAGGLSQQNLYFYEALGVRINVGYGLTETSPAVSGSTFKHDKYYIGASGPALKCVQFKITDENTGEDLGFYKKGIIKIKGPCVMKGYYKNPELTNEMIDAYGWFNSGDLGWLTYENNIVISGRKKEIIVLSNGNNVNPIPIETACLESPYIEQIILAGQDMKNVCALIVPSKNAFEKVNLKVSNEDVITNSKLRDLIEKEIETQTEKIPNLQYFETIENFVLLSKPFTLQNGLLNNKGGLKRNTIYERYKDIIKGLYQ